jgi:hypothetical protein
MIYDGDGKAFMPCLLRNVSATGAKLELDEDVLLPGSFLLALTPAGNVRRLCQPIWQRATMAGVRFVKPNA